MQRIPSSRSIPDFSNDWQEKRVLIAALFLPVHSANDSSISSTSFLGAFNAASTPNRRAAFGTSSIGSYYSENASYPVEKPALNPHLTAFHPSNAGNPGLYNALKSLSMKKTEWIGTIGSPTDHLNESEQAILSERLERDHSCHPVFVTQTQIDGHYHQFCKQVLWQAFHYQLQDYPKPKGWEENAWKYYVIVNQLFADKIISLYGGGDVGKS
jgi:trehalose-6-phosphate synthase